MQCKEQSYWHSLYGDHCHANNGSDGKSFCKRQYHKARRRHDKKIISRQLDQLNREIALYNEIFNIDNQPFIYV